MKVIVNGACGRLGSELIALMQSGYGDFSLAAAIDVRSVKKDDVSFCRLADFQGQADVLIDFSHHSATPELCRYAIERRLPLVLATTGQNRPERQCIEESAASIPIFRAANLSLGVALLTELCVLTVSTLPDTDIEIVEKHHDRKRDAPSGTALALEEAIRSVRPECYPVFGRHGQGLRSPQEIGIHALRLGNFAGEHTVFFSTDTETLTLTHIAHSPRVFAEGALAAARFLAGCAPGLYGMEELIASRRKEEVKK